MIENLAGKSPAERNSQCVKIEEKFQSLEQSINNIDLEISEMPKGPVKDEYRTKYNSHLTSMSQLRDNFDFAGRRQAIQDIQSQRNIDEKKVMNDALALQNSQKTSLDQSLGTITNIERVGNDTAVEIQRMQNQLQNATNNIDVIDSEMGRAKVIMKSMITRAAGDNCVRALAILVVIAIIAVIVVDVLSPGTVKKQVDGWVTVESG